MTATTVTPKAPVTPEPPGAEARVRVRASRLVLYTVLVVVTGLMLGPFGWLVVTGLKTTPELAASPVHWLPDAIQWHNFADAFTQIDFLGYARNSLIVSLIYATLVTLSSAWVGFGFARLDAPGKKVLFGVLLGSMMLPQMITLFPTYLIFAKLGMVDTYWPWVLWGLAAAPYLVFLFRQFFAGMPRELEEAAIVDGASYPRIFRQIFLPQSWPVLAASFVIAFTWSWGDFIAPMLLLSSDRTTLSVAIMTSYVTPGGLPVNNLLAAGSVMYVVPILLIFLVAQRGFVAGMSTTGLK
ncbi:multiple sugar transport system permease protein [Streptomyces africanus]|uniref:Multiple sugar transport system permease protein n=1 Tax=Streptomyces africanus TaxID=231024 RepID=A0ABU0QY25_9ACTN|nr:carbohydrate ABC transporter permease [Streptomyces africanus]MDQ0752246.1 multiple sugar transport system permease protein [Streptomyces africanus]